MTNCGAYDDERFPGEERVSRWKLFTGRARVGIARHSRPDPQYVYPGDTPSLEGLAVVDLGCGLISHPTAKAFAELIRIAKAGLIIAPYLFSDLLFDRTYHRWLMADRGSTLYSFRKRPEEDRPFGPEPNPFDAALNGRLRRTSSPFGQISRRLRHLYYTHHKVIEVRFAWRNSFRFVAAED